MQPASNSSELAGATVGRDRHRICQCRSGRGARPVRNRSAAIRFDSGNKAGYESRYTWFDSGALALKQEELMMIDNCNWEQDKDGTWQTDYDTWKTDCGNLFVIIEGTPADNQMRFCCYCGHKLKLAKQTRTTGGNAGEMSNPELKTWIERNTWIGSQE